MVESAIRKSSHNETSPSGAPAEGEAVRDYFSTDEIFQRVAASASEEFSLSTRLLFLGGLAAGLSIGLSFYARAAISAQVPDMPLVGNLLYPIGFLLIVIGRYQLYTENTLTPVTLVLTRLASIPALLRNWGIVLFANLVGAFILAFFLARTPIFETEAAQVALDFGLHALEVSWSALFFKAVMAGWLVASMVWLIHAARDTISRVFLVFFIMYLIPSADLYHCIVGACEVFYVAFRGEANMLSAIWTFVTPVVLGNTVGGVLLVAILNYAQTLEDRVDMPEGGQVELTLREWLFEFHTGRKPVHATNGSSYVQFLDTPVSDEEHMLGDRDAPLTLVQYGDFECASTRHIYNLARDLQHHIGDTAYRYVFRHMPLTRRHPHAMRAAIAAEAAGQQGRYWEMHEKLLQNQRMLEEEHLLQYAENLNLDIEQFQQAMTNDDIERQIAASRSEAVSNQIFTTTNLFINGKRYTGQLTMSALVEHINDSNEIPIVLAERRDPQPV